MNLFIQRKLHWTLLFVKKKHHESSLYLLISIVLGVYKMNSQTVTENVERPVT